MHELKKCNSCGNIFPGNLMYCLNDGNSLVQLESLIGIILDGRYRIESIIGTGGMGDVYRATHVHLDTEFAVKLLKPELVANQTAIKRFRLEAKAAGRIHHPNAIRVTDFGVTPERIVYLVMEIVDGRSLRELIHHEGPLDYIRTVNIVRQACGAVEAAHRGGVIHRDLKPDNILIEKVTNFERVKVLDFGIAKLKEANPDGYLTLAGTLIGTPQYMSPEQCQGKNLDPRSDIYSLGIILYEMLTGEVPFDAESALQVVVKQLHDHPRHIRELSSRVPTSIGEVVMRALEKDPTHRQSSASQLSEELKRAVGMEGEEAALSLTDSLVTRPLTAYRTPSADASDSSEESKPRLSLDEERPPAFDRETVIVSPDSVETEVVSSKGELGEGELGRVTKPNKRTPTDQDDLEIERRSLSSPPEGGSRKRLISIAAALLAAILAIVIYIAVRPKPVPPKPPGSIAPEGMVNIPGGKFIMGRNDGEPDEGPAHELEIESFYLDVVEVTNQEYKKFVDATGHPAPKNWIFNGSYAPDEANLPVTYVTWNDASAYAQWVEKRLPTEEEWEYSARGGGKQFLYPWGNEWREGYANVNRIGRSKPSPVRSFEKDLSPFNIHDMAGNVSEWVQNFYSTRYGATQNDKLRVYRGGNFMTGLEESTNTYRFSDYPDELPENLKPRIGFRCAKDIKR